LPPSIENCGGRYEIVRTEASPSSARQREITCISFGGPPPAIERQVVDLGVSPKQKERARQTFMKSTQYAGFIDASTGRFV
jgi:hypothetical protein